MRDNQAYSGQFFEQDTIMYMQDQINRRKHEREPYSTEAELYLESSIFKAKLVDVSEAGVRFEMEKPINVHVRFKVGEKRISRNAQLVWCLKDDNGCMTYGFNYIPEPEV
jgi:hypothetical protein